MSDDSEGMPWYKRPTYEVQPGMIFYRHETRENTLRHRIENKAFIELELDKSCVSCNIYMLGSHTRVQESGKTPEEALFNALDFLSAKVLLDLGLPEVPVQKAWFSQAAKRHGAQTHFYLSPSGQPVEVIALGPIPPKSIWRHDAIELSVTKHLEVGQVSGQKKVGTYR